MDFANGDMGTQTDGRWKNRSQSEIAGGVLKE
jgi:hypothetical protein